MVIKDTMGAIVDAASLDDREWVGDMTMISGYTITFLADGQVRQITMASKDEAAIIKLLTVTFGKVDILSRTGLDARSLYLMKLRPGEWVEWTMTERRR